LSAKNRINPGVAEIVKRPLKKSAAVDSFRPAAAYRTVRVKPDPALSRFFNHE
jgi:hypothetical protein